MSDRPDIDAMKRDLVHDLADEVRRARRERDENHTRDWVRGPNDDKRMSDDFGGCVE